MKADRKKVKLAMEWAHMTVNDLARAAGLPPQTTAAIICGIYMKFYKGLWHYQGRTYGTLGAALRAVWPARGYGHSAGDSTEVGR